MRISDWSSDVCSSDLAERRRGFAQEAGCALLSLAFDGLRLDSVWVPAFSDGAAKRLIARLGFRRKSADSTQAVLEARDWTYSPPCMAAGQRGPDGGGRDRQSVV